jgi:hypothetical protein
VPPDAGERAVANSTVPTIGLAARLRHKQRQQQRKLLIGSVLSVVLAAAVIGIVLMLSDHPGPGNPPATDTNTEKGESSGAATNRSARPSEPKAEPRIPVEGVGGSPQPDDGAAPPKPAPKAASGQPPADGAMSTEVGDLKVTIVAATKPRPTAAGAGAKPAAAGLLLVTVEVRNPNGTKKVEFPGWAPRGLARGTALIDNFGNVYHAKPLGRAPVPGEGPPTSIYPDGVGREVLAFEPPVPKIDFLLLELPASILGGKGVLKFKIPAEKITEQPVADAKAADPATNGKPPQKAGRPRPGSEFGIPE